MGKAAIWRRVGGGPRGWRKPRWGAPGRGRTAWSYAGSGICSRPGPLRWRGCRAPGAGAGSRPAARWRPLTRHPPEGGGPGRTRGSSGARGEGPLLVAVDDVQWIDASAAAVLSFAARRPRRVGSACCSRSGRRGQPAPLGTQRALPAQAPHAPLELPGLSLGAVSRLLAGQLDYVPARPVLHRLHEFSAGNPFFALELRRALRAGTLRLEPGERLPFSLGALVPPARRLSPGAQHASPARPRWPADRRAGHRRCLQPRATLAQAERAGRGPERGARALRPPPARSGPMRWSIRRAAAVPLRGRRPRERQRERARHLA